MNTLSNIEVAATVSSVEEFKSEIRYLKALITRAILGLFKYAPPGWLARAKSLIVTP
jgi:hypothetical protein